MREGWVAWRERKEVGREDWKAVREGGRQDGGLRIHRQNIKVKNADGKKR
jgi:hypothetical protein